MKKIGIMFSAFFAFGVTSAQTDTVTRVSQKVTVNDKTTIQSVDKARAQKNPDGTTKTTKTYEGNTKPNTNAIKNNTTGSPDPVRKATDTIATPSGTLGPDRPKGSNTTKSPNQTSPLPNTGTTVPRT